MTLDARQKAMLREMGIRVWWPSQVASAAEVIEGGHRDNRNEAARVTPAPIQPESAPTRSTPAAEADGAALGWQVGPLQTLHDAGPAGGPRWLLLVEQRQDSSGEAQRLLQAMLRAARLHEGSGVWLAPLQRAPESGEVLGLEPALADSQPDLVFIMGRLGAQALLETDEALGRLRGQIHDLWGLPAIVSYDPVTLLRSPADKGKAWDDLCLAGQVAREQYAERKASESD